MLPYVLLTENPGQTDLSVQTLLLLLVAGIVHTGIAYWLYFASMSDLKAQTVALYSYLDPILAIILSMFILKEPMTPIAAIGTVLVLSSAFLCEK
jgi:drug/metabolite transporter (DMT)-like permease